MNRTSAVAVMIQAVSPPLMPSAANAGTENAQIKSVEAATRTAFAEILVIAATELLQRTTVPL